MWLLQDKKLKSSFPLWVARDLEALFRANYPWENEEMSEGRTLYSWRKDEWVPGFSLDKFGRDIIGETGQQPLQQHQNLNSIMALEVKMGASTARAGQGAQPGLVCERYMQGVSHSMRLSAMARCHGMRVSRDRKRKSTASSDEESG